MTSQTILVKRNNKLVIGNMVRQYCLRLVWAVFEGWDAFLVKSGRIKPQESLE